MQLEIGEAEQRLDELADLLEGGQIAEVVLCRNGIPVARLLLPADETAASHG